MPAGFGEVLARLGAVGTTAPEQVIGRLEELGLLEEWSPESRRMLAGEHRIGWNSVEGEVDTSGQVRFEEVATGRTRTDVTMNYADPSGGRLGELAAVSNPEREMREDLENFARRVERGELDLGGTGTQTRGR